MGVGGAVYAGPGSAHYLRCQFFNNTSIVGGAIVCHSEGLKFQDCLFERNSADDGAVILTHSGNPVFLHCTFRGNLGETSGGILEADGGTTNFVDCTFFRNVSRHGGIANVEVAGGVRFSGCTIYQNRALYALMRIVGTGSVLSMDHTIIAGSPDGAPIWCSAGASTSIACCDLYDNHDGDWIYCAGPQFDGLTNVSVDPRFCDPDNGNFHVEPMSWCAPWNNPGCGLVGAWNVGCTVDAPEGDQQALSQAVRVLPNPSHGSCRIEWSGLAAEGVSVAIYDPAGRLVRRLDDLPDGLSSVMWNARDDSGRRLPSGIYMVRIFGVGVNETGRFVLD
jgi:hypothetical protein